MLAAKALLLSVKTANNVLLKAARVHILDFDSIVILPTLNEPAVASRAGR
jgi:hypothetical protein